MRELYQTPLNEVNGLSHKFAIHRCCCDTWRVTYIILALLSPMPISHRTSMAKICAFSPPHVFSTTRRMASVSTGSNEIRQTREKFSSVSNRCRKRCEWTRHESVQSTNNRSCRRLRPTPRCPCRRSCGQRRSSAPPTLSQVARTASTAKAFAIFLAA